MVLYTKPSLKLIYYAKQYNSEEGEILKGLLKKAARGGLLLRVWM